MKNANPKRLTTSRKHREYKSKDGEKVPLQQQNKGDPQTLFPDNPEHQWS